MDDGQLDQCSLTFRDLDNIAKAFMKVFGGYFHAREEYPDLKKEIKDSKLQDEESENESDKNSSQEEKIIKDSIEETNDQLTTDSNLKKPHKEKNK